jgi:hypothetical protein
MHCGRRQPKQGDIQGARSSEPLLGDFRPNDMNTGLSLPKQVRMSNDGRNSGKGLFVECQTSNNIARSSR